MMNVAIYAFEGITPFHLSAPLLVFGEAGWTCRVLSESGGPIRCNVGLSISVHDSADALHAPAAAPDILVIPSWHEDLRAADEDLLALIRHCHSRGTAIVGLCLGAFPVAESGVLAGRAALTHWAKQDELELLIHHRARPRNTAQAGLYIDHGDVLTSAGTAASLDACLHIVRTRLGQEAATRIARAIVIAPHREGGQAQFIDSPLPELGDAPDPLSCAIAAVRGDLNGDWSVARMAAAAHISERHFSRRFQARTGLSPARWLKQERLRHAQRLLERGTDPIDVVAHASGFNSTVTFRQAFHKAFATTPTSYRRRFHTDA